MSQRAARRQCGSVRSREERANACINPRRSSHIHEQQIQASPSPGNKDACLEAVPVPVPTPVTVSTWSAGETMRSLPAMEHTFTMRAPAVKKATGNGGHPLEGGGAPGDRSMGRSEGGCEGDGGVGVGMGGQHKHSVSVSVGDNQNSGVTIFHRKVILQKWCPRMTHPCPLLPPPFLPTHCWTPLPAAAAPL